MDMGINEAGDKNITPKVVTIITIIIGKIVTNSSNKAILNQQITIGGNSIRKNDGSMTNKLFQCYSPIGQKLTQLVTLCPLDLNDLVLNSAESVLLR